MLKTLALALLGTAVTLPLMAAPAPIDVGDRTQLLFDDYFTEKNEGFVTTMNPAQKMSEPVLLPEMPWERHGIWVWLSVAFEDGVYKMWYSACNGGWHLCLATSRDGIHWERPELDVETPGGRKSNIVFSNFPGMEHHPGCVFLDPHAPPAERYKYIYGGKRIDPRGYLGIDGAVSADGIHWHSAGDQGIIPWYTDTMNICFWDEDQQKYVAFVRDDGYAFDPATAKISGPFVARAIGRSESADFRHFPVPERVLQPDDKDPADTDLYNSAALKYPWAERSYFLFPSQYNHRSDNLDIQLCFSRDGKQFSRSWRQPFIPLGEAGAFDSRTIYLGAGIVPAGDSLYLYYGGFSVGHNGTAGGTDLGGIGMARIRRDGFVSQDAPPQGASLTTKPLRFDGDQLVLNYDAGSGGELRVALLDEAGKPLSGYTQDECLPLYGNSVQHVVNWKQGADLSALRGQPVRLRFTGRALKLYSFRFGHAPQLPAREALDGYWPLDEGQGTVVHDAGRFSLHGSILQPNWQAEAGKMLLRFGSNRARVEIPDAPLLQAGGGITVSAWIRMAQKATHTPQAVFCKPGTYRLLVYPGENSMLVELNGPGGKKVYNRFDCPLPRGQWLPVALTWDGNHLRVYADGKRVYEERASFTQAADNGAPLRFGLGQDQEQERGFEGEMRQLAVWRRALTEEEIRELRGSRE